MAPDDDRKRLRADHTLAHTHAIKGSVSHADGNAISHGHTDITAAPDRHGDAHSVSHAPVDDGPDDNADNPHHGWPLSWRLRPSGIGRCVADHAAVDPP
jgi:hypothetical protein